MVVCDTARDEIFAVKRVGWSGNKKPDGTFASVQVGAKPSASAKITLPEVEDVIDVGRPEKERVVDVLVVSDGYLGLSYKVDGVVLPLPPRVEDGGKGKGAGKKEHTEAMLIEARAEKGGIL